jgi:hypothetical protein
MGDAERQQRPGDVVPVRTIWLDSRDALYSGPLENLGPGDSVRCARCRTSFAIGDAYVLPDRTADPRAWYCPTDGCRGELADFVPVG